MSTATVSRRDPLVGDPGGGLEGYIYEELRRGESVVLEAYPGFGKTRLGSRLLSLFERAVMAVRTHEEISEVFGFLGSPKGVAYAYGKPKVCFRTDSFSYGYCRAMNVLGRCQPKVESNDVAWVVAAFREPEEIRGEAKRRGRCLYFAMRTLAQTHKKLVTTYDYLLSNPETIRRRDVAILDEAQTLLEYVEEATIAVNDAFIEALSRSLKACGETRWMGYAVRAAYRKASGIHDFVDKIEGILASAPATSSPVASQALRTLEIVADSYRRRWYSADGKTFYFMTDALPSIAKFNPKLLLGAYLPPPFMRSSRAVLRVACEAKVKMVVDTDLTSQYEVRGEDTYSGYARKLAEYAKGDAGNLAVFPSHQFMEEVLSRVRDDLRSRIIREPAGDSVPPGAILVDVAGGRYTEGVNLRGLERVIVCGMPYPEPDPTLSLLSKVYDYDMYTYVALSRALQAVGRLRGRGVAYAIDRRFARHASEIPSWIEVVNP